jgi:hypothetical protein
MLENEVLRKMFEPNEHPERGGWRKLKNVGSSIAVIGGEHCDNPWVKGEKGCKVTEWTVHRIRSTGKHFLSQPLKD